MIRRFYSPKVTLTKTLEEKLERCIDPNGDETYLPVFNVGEYRRAIKCHADKDFFDPNNAESLAVLKSVGLNGTCIVTLSILVNARRRLSKMPAISLLTTAK